MTLALAGWPKKRLKFCATYNDEVLPESTDDFTEIEYVEISDVSLVEGIRATTRMLFHEAPSRARRKVRRGDILVSTVRTYLKSIATVAEASDNLIASTGFCVIRPTAGLDAKYAGWVAKCDEFVEAVVSRSVGVSYPAINASQLVDISIPVPPLDAQRRVAAFLEEKTTRIDALIAKKQALLERLAEKRQAIITQAITKGLNPAAPMKDSGVELLGQVPAHWEVWPLKRMVASATYGVSDALAQEGEVAILRMGNLRNAELDLDDLRFLDIVDSSLLLRSGDIVFNRTNSLDLVGKSALYRGDYSAPLSLASYLVRFRFDERLDPNYAVYVMNLESLLRLARTLALPSIGQANLSPARYEMLQFPLPPVEEQRRIRIYIDSQVAALRYSEAQIETSIHRLNEYRSALITDAVTGQIEGLR